MRRARRPIAWALGAVIVAFAAGFTGYLLPWDELSLWAVSVGTNMHGYTPILRGHTARFVLVGSSEVGSGTIDRWFWVHVAAIPLIMVAALTALLVAGRRTRRRPAP